MPIPANSYIVFQAYGNKDILRECAFSLLSLCQFHSKEDLKKVEVWIYTDDPGFFTSFKDCWLNLNFKEINTAVLRQWRGEIDFVHRVKVCMLKDFIKDKTGQILYLDTDIYFLGPVAEILRDIEAGKMYMHIKEAQLHESANVLFNRLSRFIRKRNDRVQVGDTFVDIPEDTAMWNAGVLGFQASNVIVVDKVLAFTDTVYKQFPKHIIEQYAFSVYFSAVADLHSAHNTIFHYWNLKEIRLLLKSFFQHFREKSWSELVVYSKALKVPMLLQEKRRFLKNRSFVARLRKKEWMPDDPDWELLVHQG